MNKNKELAKKTLIISIGKICTSLVTFLLLPLYTKLLSTSEYGIADLVNTLIGLLVPIVTLQIEQAVFRKLIDCRNNDKQKIEVITSSIGGLTFNIVLFLIISLIIFPFIDNNYKYLLVVNLVAYTYLSFVLQIARGLGYTNKFSIGSFLSAFFIIVYNLLFIVVLRLGATVMLLGNLCGYLSSLIYMIFSIKLFSYIDIKYFSKITLKRLLRYSIPLVPNYLSWWIFTASDRLIVSTFLGVSANGIMSASLKFSAIIITLYNIFDTSWIESVSSHIDDEDFVDFYNKVFNMIFNFFGCICICMICIMPIVFPIMINETYSSGYVLVPVSIFSSLLNVVQGMLAVVYAAKKNTKSIAKTSMTAAAINLVVHFSLIKFVGLHAAVISTAAAYLTLALYRYYDINNKYFKVTFDMKKTILVISLFILSSICFYLKMNYLIIALMIVTIAYMFKSNANVLKFILTKIRRK